VNDEKLRKRSALAATLGLICSKGLHSFWSVTNCLSSLSTGICLATCMSRHDDSSKDIVRTNLATVSGTQNSSTMRFQNANLFGDHGYNEEHLFSELVSWQIEHTNTTKHGPILTFKLGNTLYKASHPSVSYPNLVLLLWWGPLKQLVGGLLSLWHTAMELVV
jgi:hypothetical protein